MEQIISSVADWASWLWIIRACVQSHLLSTDTLHVCNTSGSGSNSFSRCDAKHAIKTDMIHSHDKVNHFSLSKELFTFSSDFMLNLSKYVMIKKFTCLCIWHLYMAFYGIIKVIYVFFFFLLPKNNNGWITLT